MKGDLDHTVGALACALLVGLFGTASAWAGGHDHGDPLTTADSSGSLRTFTASGGVDTTGPFFQNLGTNGRTCNTCHRIEDAWSINPPDLQNRFSKTNGTDPVFRTVDGSNSPLADVSTTQAKKKAYSMLLNKGVIRIGKGIPANAEFTLVGVASRRTADMPLYTLRNNATGETRQTTDPGRALVTGKWADVGKFKGPILRGLAARAPYFHNGSAASLGDAIDFYDTRFNVGFSKQEKADLVAFLSAL
jgi:cytochrome c peroxidase